MQKRRLLKLADMLDEDAADAEGIKFDFSEWGWVHNRKKPMSCGTTGCAMAVAALSGEFKRAGLRYFVSPSGRLRITFRDHPRTDHPIYVAMKVFGLTPPEAQFLFASMRGMGAFQDGARAERAVAKRIRRFVAGKCILSMS